LNGGHNIDTEEYALLQQIQTQIGEMNGRLGNVEGKLDSIEDNLAGGKEQFKAHGDRLRRVEQAVLPLYAALVAGVAWIMSKITGVFGK
jgi:archaellum component FlaC